MDLFYLKIYERMEKSRELPSRLHWFSERISNSVPIEVTANDWVRLDTVLDCDEEIFLAVAHSLDHRFGLDKRGYIYCSKDYAIQVLKDKVSLLYKRKSIATNWAILLAGCLVLATIFKTI